MDSFTIHHTPEGLWLETEDKSVLIGEKDFSLINRGQARPLRDMNHQTLGRDNCCFVRKGDLVIRLDKEETVIPFKVWTSKAAIRRVLLSPSLQAVTA